MNYDLKYQAIQNRSYQSLITRDISREFTFLQTFKTELLIIHFNIILPTQLPSQILSHPTSAPPTYVIINNVIQVLPLLNLCSRTCSDFIRATCQDYSNWLQFEERCGIIYEDPSKSLHCHSFHLCKTPRGL